MIAVKNICKSFHEGKNKTSHALKDISIMINRGECAILKGVSGSGKSTLLSIMGAIMKPTSGAVEVEGKNIVNLSDFHISNYRSEKVGFVTQSFHLFDLLSVKNNLLPSLLTQDLSPEEIHARIEHAMQISNISHKGEQKVSTLSGGEKQRCMIARAMVNNPSIILCDEPTANLDKENSLKFIDIIKKLKEMGKTVVIATHDPLFDNLDFIDTVFHINEGKIE